MSLTQTKQELEAAAVYIVLPQGNPEVWIYLIFVFFCQELIIKFWTDMLGYSDAWSLILTL